MDEILWVGLFLLTILISVGKCYFMNCYDSFQVNRTCLFQEGNTFGPDYLYRKCDDQQVRV